MPLNLGRRIARAAIPDSIRGTEAYRRLRHKFGHDGIYDTDYFVQMDEWALQAAPIMARSIKEMFAPNSVIDVGCGTGALLQSFCDLGCRGTGFEYANAAIKHCQERGLEVRKFDLESKRHIESRADLAVS